MTQALALGIDVGGTNTAYALVSRDGTILTKGVMPTTGHNTVEDYVEKLSESLLEILANVKNVPVVGIGIGAPNGNIYTGDIAFAPNLPWKGKVIPLCKMISEATGLKCILTNDANAAAIGEMKYGVANGLSDFIMVTLGTGVGSGFVANGNLVYGHDGFAGELGHVVAIRNGRNCGCGRQGCLETYCSATGIVYTANEWLTSRNEHSILRGHGKSISAQDIYDAAVAGDQLALEIFEYTGSILGQTLADAVAITSPEAIIFFGGLAKAGALLLDHVKASMENNLLNIYKGKVKVILSTLPDADAAILGASALVW